MRIALLGAGRIGMLHGRLLAGDSRVDELIVADADPARAEDAARSLGGRVADAGSAISLADAAVIAASTNAHAGLVRMAIDRGIPVFCEKPLAFDLEETVALVEHVERTGAVVQVGFQRRFDPAFVEARRLVDHGDLGTLYLVRLIAHDHEPPPDAYIPVSGGLFRDSSIHDFDALRWVTGREVEEVCAVGSVRGFPIFAEYGDVDTAAAILRLEDGTLGVLSQTRHDSRGYDIRMEIVGSGDSVALGLSAHTPLRSLEPDSMPEREPWMTFLTRFEAAYRAEMLAFLQVAKGETDSPCTARDALEAMRVSVAAGRALASHRVIRMSEVAQAAVPGMRSGVVSVAAGDGAGGQAGRATALAADAKRQSAEVSWSPKVYFNGATIMSTSTVDLIRIARTAGFDGVEVRSERLLEDAGEANDAAAIVQPGEVWSLNGLQVQVRPDGQLDRERLLRELEPRLELCRALRAAYLLVVPPRVRDVDLARVIDALQVGLDLVQLEARGIGVRVAFEFLGFGDCPINSPELAGKVVAGVPAIDVVLDSCHWYASGAGPLVGFPVERLAMVHLNDVPPLAPRETEDADRVLPGGGVIRLAELGATLRDRRYRGPVSVETFNPTYWRADPLEIARLARASVDRFLAAD